MNIDLKQIFSDLAAQFQGLKGRQPGQWPLAPRVLCALAVGGAVAVAGYFLYWSGQFEEEDALAQKEQKLRSDYQSKMAQAINLDALKRQKNQVDQYVARLEKQLPSKAEMDALLSDITHAGTGRGLQFESFKPGQVVVKDYYAELPIALKLTGRYHDLGAFAADMAHMPRIVTLNNISLAAGKDNVLTLDATAKTFRYLDPEEAASQRKSRADKNKKGGAK
ncbi:type 4a pilus biogenesis protein PilO [Massilia terrae]|uniref:Type 4a pilus biogenesis protein PilO n=1 Tax=Massilia terrae TaxID=1811224 RepID=A0ABT2CXH8_9BURK|nr:type 4a pilus biogenesis protein PilO [Massilia terrae]MCS0658667.1 type 4a pilus biogenesis protein PilO [Massilia terrae]